MGQHVPNDSHASDSCMMAFTRREFIRLAATASLLAGCRPARQAGDMAGGRPTTNSSPTATSTAARTPAPSATPAPTNTATPAPTSSPGKIGEHLTSQVAFVKTDDRFEGVRRAIDLLEIDPVRDRTVFLKPNFNSSDPAPGSTHPDVLRSLVPYLKEMGAARITVGDRSGMGDTRSVMKRLGVFELADELGCDVMVLNELEAEEWEIITPSDSHWKQGFALARPCLEAEALVQACCLKTHQHGGHFTMSLKNSVGMVASYLPDEDYGYMNELHNSAYQRLMIAEINAAYSPALIVVDGVEAFNYGGPATGRLIAPQVVLAGTDRIAVDAVGVALLRYFGTTRHVAQGPIFQQEQIARAVQLGLGVDNPHGIELLPADSDSAAFAQEIQEILISG